MQGGGRLIVPTTLLRGSFHDIPPQEIFAMWFGLYCSIWLEMTHSTLLLCEYVLSDSV